MPGAFGVHMTEDDRDVARHARAYWRLTVALLACNAVLFLLSAAFISSRPILSLVFGSLNVLALSALVFLDRRVVRRGIASFWKGGVFIDPSNCCCPLTRLWKAAP